MRLNPNALCSTLNNLVVINNGVMKKIAMPATSENNTVRVSLRLEAVWDQEWERNLIEAALEKVQLQVNAKQYQIFYLHVIQQMPAKEVATTVGVNWGQVYLAKHRLLPLFKRAVKNLQEKFA